MSLLGFRMHGVNYFHRLIIWNFAIGKNHQLSDPVSGRFGQPGANSRRHHQHSRLSLVFHGLGSFTQGPKKPLGQAGLNHHLALAVLLQHVVQQLL